MKEIKLTRGRVTLIDDDLYDYLNQWKWCYNKIGNIDYAVRNVGTEPNNKTILMHRLIMQTPQGMQVDHIDGDGLNNQRHNLRNCTHAQNRRNGNAYRNNKSGYKGVSWDKRRQGWAVEICLRGKHIHLGIFDNPQDAARAYDRAAIELHGEFARTNGMNKLPGFE